MKVGKGPKARNGQKVTIRVVDTRLGIDNVSEKTFILGFSMVIDGLLRFFFVIFSYSFKSTCNSIYFIY